jgi:hypothetical protein
MPDFNLLELGGIPVIVLVIGIVEAAKRFGLRGKGCQILAMVLGGVLVGLSQAIETAMIPVDFVPWINIIVMGMGGSLAATGIYDMLKKQKAPSG